MFHAHTKQVEIQHHYVGNSVISEDHLYCASLETPQDITHFFSQKIWLTLSVKDNAPAAEVSQTLNPTSRQQRQGGVSYTLEEMLTIGLDHVQTRYNVPSAIVTGKPVHKPNTFPESFLLLVQEF